MTGTPEHPDGRPSADAAFPWRFTAPLYLGSALNPVNSSLIATALAAIAFFLHMPAGRVAVLVSCLYLASAISQPTAGKLSEVFGPRRVFLCGITLVFVGGLVGGLATNLAMLIIARVLIGIGTSAGYPSAMLLIRRRAQRAGLDAPPGGVLGGLQIAGIGTAALGLPLGGVLVEAFGWRAVFYANLPVTAISLALAVLWLPGDDAIESMSLREVSRRIDLPGIALFAGMMATLLIFLDGLPAAHWLWLGLAAALAAAFLPWELRAPSPFIDVRLLARNAALTRTYLRFALMSLCIYTVLYGLTEWVEVGRGVSAQGAGLLMLPMSGLSALLMAPISRRNLIRLPLIVAAISAGVGAAAMLLLTTSASVVWIIVVALIFGVTMATFATANQTALYRQAPPEQIGTASGLLRTFGYLGSIASAALISIAFHGSVSDGGLHHIALIMIGVSIVALLFTLADHTLGRAESAGGSPSGDRTDQRLQVAVGDRSAAERARVQARSGGDDRRGPGDPELPRLAGVGEHLPGERR